MLADPGAEVIKVEPPGSGDPARTWGARADGRSLWWSVHAPLGARNADIYGGLLGYSVSRLDALRAEGVI